MRNTKICIACGKIPARSYDIGVYLGNAAKRGRYCMECLRKVYGVKGKGEGAG